MTSSRLVKFVQDVVTAVFSDFGHLYPKSVEMERDLQRLLSQLASRGLALLVTDLPAVNKHLNQCLDVGQYEPANLVLSRAKFKGERIPKFMREMFLLIFHPDGKLRDDPSIEAIFFLKTLFNMWKSIKLPCTKDAIENEVENFFSLDDSLDPPTLGWVHDHLDLPEGIPLRSYLDFRDRAALDGGVWHRNGVQISDRERRSLELVFATVSSSLGVAPTVFAGTGTHIDCGPKHGPGVVANVPKGESKYRFPFWSNKLQQFYPRDYYALPSFGGGVCSDRDDFEYSTLEYPSRVIAVPKTLTKPRLIAAEPVEHQWIQQLLWRTLESSIQRSPIARSVRFRDQSLNQAAARSGSIDGKMSTIDLSEASDRLSCHTVERFFAGNISWLEALHACRTRRASYRYGNSHTRFTELRKFAPMGSACTFPVQTMVFASLAISAVLSDRGVKPTGKSIELYSQLVQVFGDDIVVPTANLDTVVRLLSFLGLKVNKSKTFSGNNFRESCGLEAFRGYCVTPPKMLGVPNDRPDRKSVV